MRGLVGRSRAEGLGQCSQLSRRFVLPLPTPGTASAFCLMHALRFHKSSGRLQHCTALRDFARTARPDTKAQGHCLAAQATPCFACSLVGCLGRVDRVCGRVWQVSACLPQQLCKAERFQRLIGGGDTSTHSEACCQRFGHKACYISQAAGGSQDLRWPCEKTLRAMFRGEGSEGSNTMETAGSGLPMFTNSPNSNKLQHAKCQIKELVCSPLSFTVMPITTA